MTAVAIERINLGDLDFWGRHEDEVDADLAILRRERPVSWHQHPDSGRQGFWALVRAADIHRASRETEVFSSRHGPRVYFDTDHKLIGPGLSTMRVLDPPEHTLHRRIVGKAFAPSSIALLEESIHRYADEIVAELHERDTDETLDFVDDIAAKLPIEVICDLVGVPSSDRHLVRYTAEMSIGDQDPDYGATKEAGSVAYKSLREYGEDLAEERRQRPANDLFTMIVHTEIDGEALSRDELGSLFSLLVLAGAETSRSAIARAMQAFTEFPDQRRVWMEDPAGRERGVVEEILRWGSVVRHVARVVDCDIDFEGAEMREGDKVALWYVSANRDEELYESPGVFDVLREPNPHLAFGGMGPHFCLGANLARREIAIMMYELLTNFPEIAVVGPRKRLRSLQLNATMKMPVALHG